MWRWDQAEPFGANPANEDPDANSVAFDLPLRLPGQRYDAETGLHYNYFRDYDPSLGIYKQSDPIGLGGGTNTYIYVLQNPLVYVDPSGLDVNVCYYYGAAGGFGHVGFGVGSEQGTSGYYPTGSPFGSPGTVKKDEQNQGKDCKVLPADPKQDNCMLECRARREKEPGTYSLTTNQCTSFVRECLAECGLPTDKSTGSAPRPLFLKLPGKAR